jgi:hypothetical protein
MSDTSGTPTPRWIVLPQGTKLEARTVTENEPAKCPEVTIITEGCSPFLVACAGMTTVVD